MPGASSGEAAWCALPPVAIAVRSSSSKSSPNPIVVVPTRWLCTAPSASETNEGASVTPTFARPSVSSRILRIAPRSSAAPRTSNPFIQPPDRFVCPPGTIDAIAGASVDVGFASGATSRTWSSYVISAIRSVGASRRARNAAHSFVTSSLRPAIEPERSITSARSSGVRVSAPGAAGLVISSMQWTSCSDSTASRACSKRAERCIGGLLAFGGRRFETSVRWVTDTNGCSARYRWLAMSETASGIE